MQYEYKILNRGVEHTEVYLNEFGKEGWKIVGISSGSYGLHTIFLMRQI